MKKITLTSILLLSILFTYLIVYQSNHTNKIAEQMAHYQQFDSPNRASFRDYLMMMDPQTGKIPFNKYPQAVRQTKSLQTAARNVATLQWTPLATDMGGRTKNICFDPNDATHHKVWAGSATGGLWVNNDISNPDSSWTPKSDVWPSMSVSSICFDPNNSQVMYVGTGEYETAITDMYRESSGRGYGIWKSTDGGQSFQRLSSTVDFQYISDLVVKNEGGQSVVYAGVVSGVYHAGTFQSQPSDGLYRSTDGGATWTQVLPHIQGTSKPYAPSDIEIAANGRIFVGTKRNLDGDGGACILYSDTGLSGSWTVNTQFQTLVTNASTYNIPGRVKLAAAPSNANKVYGFIAAKSLTETIEGFPQTVGKYFVYSNDNGVTWQTGNTPIDDNHNWAYLAWHALSIAVDPNNDQTLYAGGLDMYKSTDAGSNWVKISDWQAMYGGGADDYVHADIHRILFAPGSSSDLLVSTDGGVFYSQSANATSIVFYERDKAYATLQAYSSAISKTGTEFYMAGLQDNGTFLYYDMPPVSGTMVQGGDGAQCQFDADEDILITSTYDNAFEITRSSGAFLNYISANSGLFLTTFDYDSGNNIIWAIASDMHGNRLNQVLKISNITQYGNETQEFIDLNTGSNATFSAIRLIDNDNLLIGTVDGQLYKVSHINTTPVAQRLGNGVLPTAFTSGIQTGDNGQRILVTFSNYGVPSVWQSLNCGTTWTDVSGNLPDMPIRWAIYHPNNSQKVMLATEVGVWATDNINAANVIWTPQTNGLPNVRVDMLDIRPDNQKVVAGTHGRTLFTTTWDANASSVDSEAEEMAILVYPNPATDYMMLKNNNIGDVYTLYDMTGKEILSGKITQTTQHIDVSGLASGTYVLKVGGGSKRIVIK